MKTIKEKINKLVEANRVHGRKGIAIYLAAITLAIVLTAAFGSSLIIFYQLKNINEAGNSVIAFAAAETGIEWSLAYIDETNYDTSCPEDETLDNSAVYVVTCELCGASNQFLCIRSEGTYKGTQRTIKIQR
jgi:hypothetical protein